MQADLILQEESFCLEFCTRNEISCLDDYQQMAGDDGYILQERIIVPPCMIGQANNYSAKTSVPLRCNNPLIFIGHPDLPVQYSSIIVRVKKEKAKVEKSETAIKVTADGINLLYSAPVFSKQEKTGPSFIAVFNEISEVLQSFPLRESAIARTWLFMDDILKDYEK